MAPPPTAMLSNSQAPIRHMVSRAIWRSRLTSRANRCCLSSRLSQAWQASSLSNQDSQVRSHRPQAIRHQVQIISKSACNSPSRPKYLRNISELCSTLMIYLSLKFKKCPATRQVQKCSMEELKQQLSTTSVLKVNRMGPLPDLLKMKKLKCARSMNELRIRTGKSELQPTKKSIICSTVTMHSSKIQKQK